MKNKNVPDLIIDKIWQIDEAVLKKLNIQALILDVDNTLSAHGAAIPESRVLPWIKKMNDIKVPLTILSNNTKKRVEPFAKKLQLDFVHFAIKPLPGGFTKAAKRLGLPPENIGVVGDQIFTDILGGNLAGMKTILVLPLENDDDWLLRIKRRLEKKYIDIYDAQNGRNR